MHLENLVLALWTGRRPVPDVPLINVNYLPLNHAAGRVVLARTLAAGGICYFTARSDLSTFFEDIALVRPTEMLAVPRVCDMFFQRYHSELERRVSAGEERAAAEQEV